MGSVATMTTTGTPATRPSASSDTAKNSSACKASTSTGTHGGPKPTLDEVLHCQFSSWYYTFRNLPDYRRSNVTIKSIVLPLPHSFMDYLLSDGVRLPLGATNVSSCVPPEAQETEAWSSDDDEEGDEPNRRSTCHDNDEGPTQFSFPELNQSVQDAIASLGGSAMPKLNWSAPKDATWMNHGTLQCKTPGDVYLLLKSSDFVMHDVSHALDDIQQQRDDENIQVPDITYELALRKWCNLNPSMEFRCFIHNHKLVAISQRNHTQHYPHLKRDRTVIRSHIIDFFLDVVKERFADGDVESYCFDVYLDKKDRIWLLDFNVWGAQTDALLFEWGELLQQDGTTHTEEAHELDNTQPELRVVETELEIHHDPLASYRAPIDTINLASITGGDVKNFEEFMAMCERPSAVESSEL